VINLPEVITDWKGRICDKKIEHPGGGTTYVILPKITEEENRKAMKHIEDTINTIYAKRGWDPIIVVKREYEEENRGA
jgi:hypothetical protein